MVRKTKGVDLQIIAVLSTQTIPISPMDITKKVLDDDNPRLALFRRTDSLIRYHLKMLVEQGKVIKEPFKNGFIYSLNKDTPKKHAKKTYAKQ